MKRLKASAALVILVFWGRGAQADKRVDEAAAKAEGQLRKNRPEDALKTMEEAVSRNATSADAHLALGRLRERIRDFAGAAASLAKAAELSAPTPALQAEALAALSSVGLRSGSSTEAIAQARRAVQAQPSPAALAALAAALARSGSGAEALAEADKALAAGAPSAAAHEARALALTALGRGAEGEAAARQALTLEDWKNLSSLNPSATTSHA